MTMNTDFLDAHERHYDDANKLYGDERWANADHLYGVSVECGLKRLMLAFGMPFDTVADRPQDRGDHKHADGIWARYESYRSGNPLGAGYALQAINPFSDWDVAQRYAHQAHFDVARVDPHRYAADFVNQLVIKAMIEGLL